MVVNSIIQRVGVQSGAAFSYGVQKIYGLIIVQIAPDHFKQATRDFPAPLGCGVKSTGAGAKLDRPNESMQKSAKCCSDYAVDLKTVSLVQKLAIRLGLMAHSC